MNGLRRYFRGEWSKRFFVRTWYPITLVVLFAGIGLSWYFFPGPFDWRYRVISSLISQVDNPGGNRYFCLSLALTMIMLIPVAGFFRRGLESVAPGIVGFSYHSILLGFVGSSIVALERLFFRNISSGIRSFHEYLALTSFTGLFLGVIWFWWSAVQSHCIRKRLPTSTAQAIFAASALPVIGMASSQAYLFFNRRELGWVGPHWAKLGIPLYLSFAFWEWLACLSIFFYLYATLALTPEVTSSKKTPKARRKAS